MSRSDFRTYASVEEAEKRLRQETLAEHAHALNNHADSLVELNQHHQEMHAAVQRLNDQMDAVLDSLTQINRRLDALEHAKPGKGLMPWPEDEEIEGQGHA